MFGFGNVSSYAIAEGQSKQRNFYAKLSSKATYSRSHYWLLSSIESALYVAKDRSFSIHLTNVACRHRLVIWPADVGSVALVDGIKSRWRW